MTFHEQSFATRFAKMGDEAEGVFEEVWPTSWVRFGINRPPLNLAMLPERIRHTPDYLTSNNLVECKGIGKADVIKIKVVEYSCMQFWNQVHPLVVFIWSSHRKAWATSGLTNLQSLIDMGRATLGTYHDGRAFFSFEADQFTWTPR